jgi:hypothetical protein
MILAKYGLNMRFVLGLSPLKQPEGFGYACLVKGRLFRKIHKRDREAGNGRKKSQVRSWLSQGSALKVNHIA